MVQKLLVITAPRETDAEIYLKELQRRQAIGIIPGDVDLISVSDPEGSVGGGGATLNGLLAATEFLCGLRGFPLLNDVVLEDSKIIIFHLGRKHQYAPIGNAFITLPSAFDLNPFSEPLAQIDSLIRVMTTSTSSAQVDQGGLWVCSSDAFLLFQDPTILSSSSFKPDSAIAYSIPCPASYAQNHGIYLANDSGAVKRILYQSPLEEIEAHFPGSKMNQVPVVSGLLFFGSQVAKVLLSLCSTPPVDACTYLGIDNGAPPLSLSLYFDILGAMAIDSAQHQVQDREVQRLLSQTLGHFRLTLQVCQGFYAHFPPSLRKFMEAAHQMKSLLPLYGLCENKKIHALCDDQVDFTCLNSRIAQEGQPSEDCWIEHSDLKGPWRIGAGSFLSGISCEIHPLELAPFMSLQQHRVALGGKEKVVLVKLALDDHVSLDFHDSRATICGLSWGRFFELSSLSEEDIWIPHDHGTSKRLKLDGQEEGHRVHPKNLLTAKLFWVFDPKQPFHQTTEFQSIILELEQGPWPHKKTQFWRDHGEKRFSLQELSRMISPEAEFAWRRELSYQIDLELISRTFQSRAPLCVLPALFRIAVEGQRELLGQLDRMAISSEPDVAARIMASIAEFLAFLASNKGGLIRSGPASNIRWKGSYELLLNQQQKAGIQALAKERENWMSSPKSLVRAARHYEGASHILIRNAVLTASQFISRKSSPLPPLNTWVVAETPCRIDLAGGWSDTPPITFESGGTVLNLALQVDQTRPIGAKVCRTPACTLTLVLKGALGEEKRLTCTKLEDLANYNHPLAPGALLKAALVVAEVVDLRSDQPLEEQLQDRYASGFEIHTWSNLPQGSGLGTSSILAGALLGALGEAMGKKYDITSLVHAVMYLEQILTTGGGWQDQVGGMLPGAKLTTSKNQLPLKVEPQQLRIDREIYNNFEKHLFLVYTGKTRLARELLQNVIRRWYSRKDEIAQTAQDLTRNAIEAGQAFEKGDISKVGECLGRYWSHKKKMAADCEPLVVSKMMGVIADDVWGQELAGAGGGGFMFAITKEPDVQEKLKTKIQLALSKEELREMSFHSAHIDHTGLSISYVKD